MVHYFRLGVFEGGDGGDGFESFGVEEGKGGGVGGGEVVRGRRREYKEVMEDMRLGMGGAFH